METKFFFILVFTTLSSVVWAQRPDGIAPVDRGAMVAREQQHTHERVRASEDLVGRTRRFRDELKLYFEDRAKHKIQPVEYSFPREELGGINIREVFFEQLLSNHTTTIETYSRSQKRYVPTFFAPAPHYIPPLERILPLDQWPSVLQAQLNDLKECGPMGGCQDKYKVFVAVVEKYKERLLANRPISEELNRMFLDFLHEVYKDMDLRDSTYLIDNNRTVSFKFLEMGLELMDSRAHEKLRALSEEAAIFNQQQNERGYFQAFKDFFSAEVSRQENNAARVANLLNSYSEASQAEPSSVGNR